MPAELKKTRRVHLITIYVAFYIVGHRSGVSARTVCQNFARRCLDQPLLRFLLRWRDEDLLPAGVESRALSEHESYSETMSDWSSGVLPPLLDAAVVSLSNVSQSLLEESLFLPIVFRTKQGKPRPIPIVNCVSGVI